MADLIDNGDVVYHGLTSPLPVLAMVFARRILKRDFTWASVIEHIEPIVEKVKLKPSTGDPYVEPEPLGILTTIDAFDIAAKGKLTTMFFGAAQVDEEGNINLTVIGDYDKPRVKLPGGAATAYLFPLVPKIILWARHEPRVLVRHVDFITGPGRLRIEKGFKHLLCTNKALIEFTSKGPVLRRLLPGASIDDVLKSASMRIIVPDKVDVLEPVSEEEMKVIEEHDPQGIRYLQKMG
ncbi:MAG: acyl CoA--acetate/3-ketoacid CoA transferase subunit beta [Hyperthermus sp.]|nr:MAG: acyl CoA--acetate/3-ketoacid CoA transferase subunit beta [Hyperthermus sp.]